MSRGDIFDAIDAERDRQEQKWGGEHPQGWGSCASDGVTSFVKVAVLAEECGEVARAALESKPDDLRRELVQVAAVAVAWLESL